MVHMTKETLLREALSLVATHGSINKASEVSGISRATLQDRYKKARERLSDAYAGEPAMPVPHPLPQEDISDEEWLNIQRRRFRYRKQHWQQKVWRPVQIPVSGPYGLLVLGDPHVDDDGADWDQIQALSELQRRNRGRIWSVNIGDTTNNWSGRLAKLWANQSTSAADAKRAARIFLRSFDWLLWLHGNHDMWDGPVGADWFEAHKPEFCVMENWSAKLSLVSPCGTGVRAWFAHDFKGHSYLNNMYGLLRAARVDDPADLYVAGHQHTAGVMQFENPHHNTTPVLLRVRGFKYLDPFAHRHQFAEVQQGAAGLVVVNPAAQGVGRVTAFLDVEMGERCLHELLRRHSD